MAGKLSKRWVEYRTYNVADLPSAPIDGQVATILDGSDGLDVATGGGSDLHPAMFDGTNWLPIALSSGLTVVQTNLTIASDAITLPAGGPGFTLYMVKVDTESAAATDNLATINGGSQFDLAILWQTDNARDVTYKDIVGGSDNLQLAGDFAGTAVADMIVLFKYGASQWAELSRSNNA